PVLRREVALVVHPGEDLGGAVVRAAGVEGDGGGDERPREGRPGDVILVQVVAAGARRLEDQFVLEQVGRLAAEGPHKPGPAEAVGGGSRAREAKHGGRSMNGSNVSNRHSPETTWFCQRQRMLSVWIRSWRPSRRSASIDARAISAGANSPRTTR